jgi:hypothetical protein
VAITATTAIVGEHAAEPDVGGQVAAEQGVHPGDAAVHRRDQAHQGAVAPRFGDRGTQHQQADRHHRPGAPLDDPGDVEHRDVRRQCPEHRAAASTSRRPRMSLSLGRKTPKMAPEVKKAVWESPTATSSVLSSLAMVGRTALIMLALS